MPDITATLTYREIFFHDVRSRYDTKVLVASSTDGFATYQEAVEDAARFGVPSFSITKVYVRVVL